MAHQTAQHAVVIGKRGTITGLRMFGFQCMEIDSSDDMQNVIEQLERDQRAIGMVLMTSDIELSDRQKKRFQKLELPSITIPLHSDHQQIAATQMELLIEKAVGMKLNFLK